ncbi:MAG: hypothetical protein KGH96_23015 [Sphingomonadales bacterium]|nr:hypothetical protein [Sphingomonadales bacterium]
MDRHLLPLLALALAATPAMAQDTSSAARPLNILGTAPTSCVLGAPSVVSSANASFTLQSSNAGEVRITQLVNPQTANPQAASLDLSLPVICNAAHTVTVRSTNGGLLRDGGSAANLRSNTDFGDFVDYTIALRWSGRNLSQSSTSGALALAMSNAASGDADLRISTPSGGGVLTAGRYSDTVIIAFQPAN